MKKGSIILFIVIFHFNQFSFASGNTSNLSAFIKKNGINENLTSLKFQMFRPEKVPNQDSNNNFTTPLIHVEGYNFTATDPGYSEIEQQAEINEEVEQIGIFYKGELLDQKAIEQLSNEELVTAILRISDMIKYLPDLSQNIQLPTTEPNFAGIEYFEQDGKMVINILSNNSIELFDLNISISNSPKYQTLKKQLFDLFRALESEFSYFNDELKRDLVSFIFRELYQKGLPKIVDESEALSKTEIYSESNNDNISPFLQLLTIFLVAERWKDLQHIIPEQLKKNSLDLSIAKKILRAYPFAKVIGIKNLDPFDLLNFYQSWDEFEKGLIVMKELCFFVQGVRYNLSDPTKYILDNQKPEMILHTHPEDSFFSIPDFTSFKTYPEGTIQAVKNDLGIIYQAHLYQATGYENINMLDHSIDLKTELSYSKKFEGGKIHSIVVDKYQPIQDSDFHQAILQLVNEGVKYITIEIGQLYKLHFYTSKYLAELLTVYREQSNYNTDYAPLNIYEVNALLLDGRNILHTAREDILKDLQPIREDPLLKIFARMIDNNLITEKKEQSSSYRRESVSQKGILASA